MSTILLVVIALLGYCFLFARVIYLDSVINDLMNVPWFKDSIALNKTVEEHSTMIHHLYHDPWHKAIEDSVKDLRKNNVRIEDRFSGKYGLLEMDFKAMSNDIDVLRKIVDVHRKVISDNSTNNNKGCKCEKRTKRIARDNKGAVN